LIGACSSDLEDCLREFGQYPALVAAGRDPQIEKAVEVLLSKLPKK